MFITLLLLIVPMTALGLVLGMDRLEDSLLKAPARHRGTGRTRSPADAVTGSALTSETVAP